MPRAYKMSWEDKPYYRWVKMYDGMRYRITCADLRLPRSSWTKEGSYQAANEWWRKKRAEIDSQNGLPICSPEPVDELVLTAAGIRLLEQRFPDLIQWMTCEQKQLFVQAFRPVVLERMVKTGELPAGVEEELPPAKVQQYRNVIQVLRGENNTPSDRRLGYHRERWLEMQTAKVAAGELVPARADNNRIALSHFITFMGAESPVEAVTPVLIEQFYRSCLGKVAERNADPKGKAGWGPEYATKVFAAARVFIRRLVEQGLIETPPNLESRGFRFRSAPQKIKTWTLEEVQVAQKLATGQTRLHLLLMLNCGMTQVDIADLKDDEVDWTSGRIRRKRSKTADHKNVPTVEYPLWPRTFELLKAYRSGGELVMLTESGRPWVRTELKDGKLVKSDSVASCYVWLKKRIKKQLPGFDKNLKQLKRKTAASLLESHRDYRRDVELFLGHSPRSIAARHYAQTDQPLFDEAVLWLGQQLGQVPTTTGSPGK